MSEPEISPSPPLDHQDSAPIPSSPPAKSSAIKFSIWPPTQRTRDAVISRLIETLSTPSILSKRYGTMPHDEAASVARVIEEEAYAAGGGASTAEDDGIEVLQVYSKEISKRMLEAVKARVAPVENGETEGASPLAAVTAIDEETPTLESES